MIGCLIATLCLSVPTTTSSKRAAWTRGGGGDAVFGNDTSRSLPDVALRLLCAAPLTVRARRADSARARRRCARPLPPPRVRRRRCQHARPALRRLHRRVLRAAGAARSALSCEVERARDGRSPRTVPRALLQRTPALPHSRPWAGARRACPFRRVLRLLFDFPISMVQSLSSPAAFPARESSLSAPPPPRRVRTGRTTAALPPRASLPLRARADAPCRPAPTSPWTTRRARGRAAPTRSGAPRRGARRGRR